MAWLQLYFTEAKATTTFDLIVNMASELEAMVRNMRYRGHEVLQPAPGWWIAAGNQDEALTLVEIN